MALAAEPTGSLAQSTSRANFAPHAWDSRFYLGMAVASTFLVFLAFSRTFYLKSYFATPPLDSLVVLHGFVFTTWMLLFVVQTALIATGRRLLHHRLGYAGGILALIMIILGLAVAFHAEKLGHHVGAPDPETTFLISLGDILTFAVFVTLGFLGRHNREAHQRLMLLAVVAGLLAATPPRLPLVGGNLAAMAAVGFTFLFAGPIYDLISRRRIHPAYLWGCAFAVLTGPPVRLMIASTPRWHQMAKWLTGLQ